MISRRDLHFKEPLYYHEACYEIIACDMAANETRLLIGFLMFVTVVRHASDSRITSTLKRDWRAGLKLFRGVV